MHKLNARFYASDKQCAKSRLPVALCPETSGQAMRRSVSDGVGGIMHGISEDERQAHGRFRAG
jgi:hypothetical protein